ncbi:hypothetical protein ABT390_13530 [Streptomyces aurantiacus]|uniref:Head-to-tail adaptor n=1 Tax=Streptomyces aurantiacus JA 4570 TaxID=1286094 RepID=S3ZB29_9ACTN|nr:hypothetical protein [Streptomyces aurantiacus]EPH40338.1 hypothetical protein STRAU_6601 [Streptomyces aurantiacus JA 4570]
MGRVYATPEQLAAWTGRPAPADAERLLARASEDVDDTLRTAVYLTDNAGMPTDPPTVAALRHAVCAQVEYQLATGDDGTGASGRWDSVSIGPVSLSGRKDGPQTPDDLHLAPRALRALTRAGLLPGVIW